MKPDYSRMTWGELQDVLRHINPEAAVDNYERLIAEIERRRPAHDEELRQHQARLDKEYEEALALRRSLRPIVGWWQIATGVGLLVIAAISIANSGSGALAGQQVLAALLFALAGILLLRKALWGYIATVINAALTLIDFAGFGFQYFYRGLVSLHFSFVKGSNGWSVNFFDLSIWPGLRIDSAPPDVLYLGINLVSVGILVIMWPTREDASAFRAAEGLTLKFPRDVH